MTRQHRDLLEDLKKACRDASDAGLTVPQIDDLPQVDTLIRQRYTDAHLMRTGRHTVIRACLQDEVDDAGIRQRVAIFSQPHLPGLDPAALPGEPRQQNAVYMHRTAVLADPALSQGAILRVRKLICGIVRKTPLLPTDTRLQLLTDIGEVFDRLSARLAL